MVRLELDRDLRRALDVPAPRPPLVAIHARARRGALRERVRHCVLGALVAVTALCIIPAQHGAHIQPYVSQSGTLPHPQPAPAPSV
jgi:hypothetical protein